MFQCVHIRRLSSTREECRTVDADDGRSSDRWAIGLVETLGNWIHTVCQIDRFLRTSGDARTYHGCCSAPNLNSDSNESSSKKELMITKNAFPGSAHRNGFQRGHCLGRHPPICRENQRRVTDVCQGQFVPKFKLILAFSLMHRFATIVACARGVRRYDADVQGRPTTWNGCLSEYISWAECWSTGDQTWNFCDCCAVCHLNEMKDGISDPVMASDIFTSDATQRMRTCCIQYVAATWACNRVIYMISSDS